MPNMITSPKLIATPTWPSCCVFASTMIAPQPAKTSAKVPIASAVNARNSPRFMRRPVQEARLGWRCGRGRRRRAGSRSSGRDARAVHPVCDLVRELDGHVLEARCLEPGDVLALRERTRDAADAGAALCALLGAQAVLGDNVADADASAGLQHTRDLGQHRR